MAKPTARRSPAQQAPTPPPSPRGPAVLVRGEHQLQIGSDPERSVLVDLPTTVSARAVTDLLQMVDAPGGAGRLRSRLREIGLDQSGFDEIMGCVRAPATAGAPGRPSSLRICLHGGGPLRDGLETALSGVGHPVTHSSTRRARPWRTAPTRPTLVVLTDFAHHDPLVVGDLMHHRVPHLPVLLRDGVGVVGPLVLPGRSSCLRCADHHRAAMDPDWPLVCAQLVNRAGFAGDAITRLTIGVVHEQIEQITAGLAPGHNAVGTAARPDLIDRTVEVHPRPLRLRHKAWPAHPSCTCGARWRDR